MRYKVGDEVRVRGDLEIGKRCGIKIFTDEKVKHKGEILEIFDILKQDGAYQYRLVNSSWYSPEMLRPAEFKIWCETEEELKAVLDEINNEKYFEKHEAEYWHIAPVGIIVEKIKNEHQCVVRQCIYKSCFDGHYDKLIELTPSEFTGIDFSEKIIITKTSTGATAIYGNKTVTAEGDFEDASRQALAEVLCPFKVGDKVKVTRNNFIGVVKKVDIYNQVTIKRGNCETTEFIGELEPYTEPLYNAKLFCIKDGYMGCFKQGHIYEVKDGKFTDSNVDVGKFKNLEEINSKLIAQFMEVKGGLDD